MAAYHPALRCVSLLALMSLSPAVDAIGISDWLGTYEMDHDGWRGTLTISEARSDCTRPAWCTLVLGYRDSRGEEHGVRIERMDARLQQMNFVITFRGNHQRFTGYLFGREPGKIAGVTYWGGQTFGFFAQRKAAAGQNLRLPSGRVKELVIQDGGRQSVTPGEDAIVSRRVLPSGEIERRYASGMIERVSSGRVVRIMPDGSERTLMMQQVIPAAPPQPPAASPEGAWLQAHAGNLLNVIISLAAGDANARSNYLASEGSLPNIYERIQRRIEAIGYLAGP